MPLLRRLTLAAAAFAGLLTFALSAQQTGSPVCVGPNRSVQGTVVSQYVDLMWGRTFTAKGGSPLEETQKWFTSLVGAKSVEDLVALVTDGQPQGLLAVTGVVGGTRFTASGGPPPKSTTPAGMLVLTLTDVNNGNVIVAEGGKTSTEAVKEWFEAVKGAGTEADLVAIVTEQRPRGLISVARVFTSASMRVTSFWVLADED